MHHRSIATSAAVLAGLAACALVACSGGDTLAPPAPDAPATSQATSPALVAATSCSFQRSRTTMRLLADCSTSETIWVPDGVTLDGGGNIITAVDPAGGHFVGAIIENAGPTARVRNVRLAAAIADVCDDDDARLAGIRFTDASGEISGNTLTGVTQRRADGTISGCQEGFSIWVRSRAWSGPRPFTVVISDNDVTDYMKEGVFASGNVAADIRRNVIRGGGPQPNQAQYGIEVTTSAGGRVEKNDIADNVYTGWYPAFAGGINSDSATGLVIENNDVARSSAGIQLFANRDARVSGNSVTGGSIPCPAFVAAGEPCRFGVQVSGSDDRISGNRFAVLDVGIDILQPAHRIAIWGNRFRDVAQEVRGTSSP